MVWMRDEKGGIRRVDDANDYFTLVNAHAFK
jgi:hypothetical protein